LDAVPFLFHPAAPPTQSFPMTAPVLQQLDTAPSLYPATPPTTFSPVTEPVLRQLDNEGAVSNCCNTGAVTGKDWVGGVAGWNKDGTASNCYNTGNLAGEKNVGGVAGYNEGAVSNCYNTGDVAGKACIGGVAGEDRGAVEYCYNTGAVTGNNNVGGVVGVPGKTQHCLSLSLTVAAGDEGADVGRVAMVDWKYALSGGNKARADMKVYEKNTAPVTPESNFDGRHGEDVPLGAPLAEVFAGWSGDVWNIPSGNLTAGAALPTLKAAPQNPAPMLP